MVDRASCYVELKIRREVSYYSEYRTFARNPYEEFSPAEVERDMLRVLSRHLRGKTWDSPLNQNDW